MARSRRHILVFAILLVFVLAPMLWMLGRNGNQLSPLSVTFAGWTNNPAWTPPPNRLELGRGATGRCALFWVTNTGNPRERVWFDAMKVEQKVDGQWRAFVPANPGWSGVEGSIWMGGYGCHYAVALPPGLQSNAIWRLQVRCGRDRSSLKLVINSWLGREFFRRSEGHVSLPSSEVIP
jgi:hypothetical protein